MFDETEIGEFRLAAEAAALQQQLAKLDLAPPRLDRDALMFAAGRAAGLQQSTMPNIRHRAAWLWPAATAITTAASLLLAAMLVQQSQPRGAAQQAANPQAAVAERVEVAEVRRLRSDDAAMLSMPRATSGYLGLRHLALTQGVAALETERLMANGRGTGLDAPSRPAPANARDLFNELLHEGSLNTRS